MRLLRYLCRVTGLTERIQRETLVRVGKLMENFAPWFSGSIMTHHPKHDVYNALRLYAAVLRSGAQGVGPKAMEMRELIYLADNEKLSEERIKSFLGLQHVRKDHPCERCTIKARSERVIETQNGRFFDCPICGKRNKI